MLESSTLLNKASFMSSNLCETTCKAWHLHSSFYSSFPYFLTRLCLPAKHIKSTPEKSVHCLISTTKEKERKLYSCQALYNSLMIRFKNHNKLSYK